MNSVDKCDDRCIRLERWAVIPPPEQTQTITKDNSDILMLKLELSNLKETCVKEFSEIKALILKQNEAKNSTNEYKKTVIHKDDEAPQSVINLFPINSDEQLNRLNNFDDTQKLSAITTAKQLISYGGLCQNMNRIFGNRIVVNYNYDGKRGKKSLKELSNVNEILFKAAFRNGYTMLDYEGDLRKGFKIMKNRYFKNECMKRKKVDLR